MDAVSTRETPITAFSHDATGVGTSDIGLSHVLVLVVSSSVYQMEILELNSLTSKDPSATLLLNSPMATMSRPV